MEYKIKICKDEYAACMQECVDELRVLEERQNSKQMSDEDKELLKRLKKRFNGPRRGRTVFLYHYSRNKNIA